MSDLPLIKSCYNVRLKLVSFSVKTLLHFAFKVFTLPVNVTFCFTCLVTFRVKVIFCAIN